MNVAYFLFDSLWFLMISNDNGIKYFSIVEECLDLEVEVSKILGLSVLLNLASEEEFRKEYILEVRK